MIKYHSFILIFILLIIPSFSYLGYSQGPEEENHKQWEYVLEGTGDVLQIALPVAAGITTVVLNDWKGTKQFAFSYATSLAITYSLKKIVRKRRPEGRYLYDAFPSGHSTSAFSGASFIQRRYGWKYGKWAYVLASIVGVSRVEGSVGWHDFWDVIAGASIGIGSTYLFTTPYENQKIEVGFYSKNNNYLLSFSYRF